MSVKESIFFLLSGAWRGAGGAGRLLRRAEGARRRREGVDE